MLVNPKRVAVLAATLTIAAPAVAQATQTVGIPGFNCSVTAYTPTRYLNGASYIGGVSCGGSQASYSKRLDVSAVQLLQGGWSQFSTSGYTGWFAQNPLQTGFSQGPCVSKRWYATIVSGEVNHAPLDASSSANTEGSGWQCP